ncbi:hypothetical protein VTO73DRAFT_4016 [Trametes versicolor]
MTDRQASHHVAAVSSGTTRRPLAGGGHASTAIHGDQYGSGPARSRPRLWRLVLGDWCVLYAGAGNGEDSWEALGHVEYTPLANHMRPMSGKRDGGARRHTSRLGAIRGVHDTSSPVVELPQTQRTGHNPACSDSQGLHACAGQIILMCRLAAVCTPESSYARRDGVRVPLRPMRNALRVPISSNTASGSYRRHPPRHARRMRVPLPSPLASRRAALQGRRSRRRGISDLAASPSIRPCCPPHTRRGAARVRVDCDDGWGPGSLAPPCAHRRAWRDVDTGEAIRRSCWALRRVETETAWTRWGRDVQRGATD